MSLLQNDWEIKKQPADLRRAAFMEDFDIFKEECKVFTMNGYELYGEVEVIFDKKHERPRLSCVIAMCETGRTGSLSEFQKRVEDEFNSIVDKHYPKQLTVEQNCCQGDCFLDRPMTDEEKRYCGIIGMVRYLLGK